MISRHSLSRQSQEQPIMLGAGAQLHVPRDNLDTIGRLLAEDRLDYKIFPAQSRRREGSAQVPSKIEDLAQQVLFLGVEVMKPRLEQLHTGCPRLIAVF